MVTTTDPNLKLRPSSRAGPPYGLWARYGNAAAAVWLFISAFAWLHTAPQRTNTWLIAVVMLATALFAVGQPVVRYLNTALAVWLFASALWMRSFSTTIWNNAIVAVVVLILSLVPSDTSGGPHSALPPPPAPPPA